MKFTSTQENLSQGLSLVSHIAAKNTTLPILNNVLIRAEKGVITLSTTNLEMGMYCTLRGKIDTEGSFTVTSKLLADFVNLLDTDTVEVALVNDSVEINTQNAHTSIKGQSPEDFPLIPVITSDSTFTCKPKDFIDALSQVAFATAHSDTRPEITGVLMRFENGSLIMAATDSYRLAEKSIRCKGVETKQVIVPSRSLLEVSRVLSSLVATAVDEDAEV
ncbi:DNA polymerase III subunit beta, partial [Candidatus Falkowbacteria bacterium]|nr:DNA polymerase III subunit beta [Candidatus Falkowbacteria bacterium]